MESEFRLITLEDLPSMLKWGGHFDPRLEHYSFVDFDLDDIHAWYHTKQKFLTRKLYGLIVDNAVVGFITLKKINFIYRTAEIGIAVNPDELGKGYGTRMIRSLLAHVYSTFPIETVFLDVAEFNVNARRLYEKCGFMYAGEEIKIYENQMNKKLLTDFPNDFFRMENGIYTKFLRMSHQKSTLTEQAPAKINLGLRIVGADENYHQLVTTMVTSDFFDIVHVRINKKLTGIRILSKHEGIEERRNLCYKAAALFLRDLEFTDEDCYNKGIEISIYKKIPEGAGMGGGSADAAAVLRALNQLYGFPYDETRLEELAFELGSDVPFCVGGGAAIATGRGEKLERFQIEKPLHVLVYPPTVKLSTASVFEEYDRLKLSEKGQSSDYVSQSFVTENNSVIRRFKKSVSADEAYAEALRLKQLIGDCGIPSHEEIFRNSMYMSIYEKLIQLIPPNDLKTAAQNLTASNANDFKNGPNYAIKLLMENGAVYAAMSGSGPSVYGIFESEFDARRAQKKLPQSVYSIIKQEERQ